MSGIFPLIRDGGLPPNPSQPNNPAQAFPPTVPPIDTAALYYGNGCDVRLRPHVLNSLISEIAATADRAAIPYNPSSLKNLETAVRYLIQRGLPRGALLSEQGPFYYTVTLDPPPLAYSDFMTLSLVPAMLAGDTQNQGYVRISVNNLGYVPLLRNDGQELRAADLRPGKPIIVTYYQGAFFHVGLVGSQVPLVLVGAITFWVRPDGHDDTGDGTANTPDKAFRTIEGCWNAVGSRYAGSPTALINIQLGVPGDYEGAAIGPYGASVYVTGDVYNTAAYRILCKPRVTGDNVIFAAYSLGIGQINNCIIQGVNLVMNYPPTTPNGVQCLRVSGGSVAPENVRYTIETNNPVGNVLLIEGAGKVSWIDDNTIVGNNHTIQSGVSVVQAGQFMGCPAPWSATWHWNDITFSQAGYVVIDRSSASHGATTNVLSNTNGPRYIVTSGGILYLVGQQIPGSTPGTVNTQGQVI